MGINEEMKLDAMNDWCLDVCYVRRMCHRSTRRYKKNFYMEHPPCLDHVSWKHMDNNNKNDTSKNIYKYMHMFIIYVWFLYMLLFTSFFSPIFQGWFQARSAFQEWFQHQRWWMGHVVTCATLLAALWRGFWTPLWGFFKQQKPLG